MNAPADLRKLLEQPGLIRAPGVFDGLGAHLVRDAGFSAAYLTGAGVSVSGYGLPDIGLLTGTEMADRAAVIAEASGLPVIADADTGYGNALNVTRTVRATSAQASPPSSLRIRSSLSAAATSPARTSSVPRSSPASSAPRSTPARRTR